MSYQKLVIILPTLNEEGTVGKVIDEIPTTIPILPLISLICWICCIRTMMWSLAPD